MADIRIDSLAQAEAGTGNAYIAEINGAAARVPHTELAQSIADDVVGRLETDSDFVRGNAVFVDTIGALKALPDTSLAHMMRIHVAGYEKPGDGGGGIFRALFDLDQRWVSGHPTSGALLSNPEDYPQLTPDDGMVVESLSGQYMFVRDHSGPLNTAHFGMTPDRTAAQNTLALSNAWKFMTFRFRDADALAEEHGYALHTPPGVYPFDHLTMHSARTNFAWHAQGATLVSGASGEAVISLIHSRGWQVSGLKIVGDRNSPPARGFEAGYAFGAISSGKHVLVRCETDGAFEDCGAYFGGSEEVHDSNSQFKNEIGVAARYDGLNLWGKLGNITRSASADHMSAPIAALSITPGAPVRVTVPGGGGWATGDRVGFCLMDGAVELQNPEGAGTIAKGVWQVTVVNDTTLELDGTDGADVSAWNGTGRVYQVFPASFVELTMSMTSFQATAGDGGPAVEIALASNLRFENGYALVEDGPMVAWHLAPEVSQNYGSSNHLGLHLEGTNAREHVRFVRTRGNIALQGSELAMGVPALSLVDHSSHTKSGLFGIDDPTGSRIVVQHWNIDVPSFTTSGAQRMCLDPLRFSGAYDITTRNGLGMFDLPRNAGGTVRLGGVDNVTFPQGSYTVPYSGSTDQPLRALHKGQHVFAGRSDAAILTGELDSTDSVTIHEGTVGLKARTAAPTNPAAKLYNVAGQLYFGTTALGAAGGEFTNAVKITSSDADNLSDPVLELFRNSGSPANNDFLGEVRWTADTDAGTPRTAAKMRAAWLVAADANATGIVDILVRENGVEQRAARFRANYMLPHVDELANLPTTLGPVFKGAQAFAENALKPGESTGQGTGMPVFYDGVGNWLTFDGNPAND